MYEILCDGCDRISFAFFHTKEIAIAAWNTRVAAPAVTGVPSEVYEALRELVNEAVEWRWIGYGKLMPHVETVRVWLSQQGGSE